METKSSEAGYAVVPVVIGLTLLVIGGFYLLNTSPETPLADDPKLESIDETAVATDKPQDLPPGFVEPIGEPYVVPPTEPPPTASDPLP